MILNYLILAFSIIAFLGYSILLKRFLFYSKNNYEYFNDYDIFFGIALVFVIIFLFNIFLPLIYFTELFFIIGVLLFMFLKKHIEFNNKIFSFFIILFALVFITYDTQTVYDTKLYHLQILNWSSFYKLNFGLANLEIRFGTNSFWQFVLSIFNNPRYDVQLLYIFNCIPVSILINQFYISKSKEINLSFIYIFSCLNFILIFSIIHSDLNGLILNSLRSPEVDTVGMFFLIFSIYFFLKYFENFKHKDYIYCFIFSGLAAITKTSHIGTLLLPIFIFFYSKPNNTRILVIGFIIFFLWVLKNFILSGCWLFPLSFTCFPVFSWSTPMEEIELYSKIVSSYPRAHSSSVSFMNFDYTLNSYEWFYPWLKTYFFATGFFIIFLIVTGLSLLFIIFRFFQKDKNLFLNKIFYTLTIFYIFNLYIWFNAPELRFGYGLFISFCCLIFSYSFKTIIYKFDLINKFKFLPIFFILILIFQNYKNIYLLNDVSKIQFDNSNINFFKKINNINFYKSDVNHGFCNDFRDPCIIYPKEIDHMNHYNYNFFYRVKK